MRYLDTSVVISAANERDPNHERAIKLLSEDSVISELVKAELYSVTSRTVRITGEELEALVEYVIEISGAELVEISWSDVFRSSYVLAGDLQLKTLDLLHISAASVMDAEEFATLDRGIVKRRERIEELTGIKVIS